MYGGLPTREEGGARIVIVSNSVFACLLQVNYLPGAPEGRGGCSRYGSLRMGGRAGVYYGRVLSEQTAGGQGVAMEIRTIESAIR